MRYHPYITVLIQGYNMTFSVAQPDSTNVRKQIPTRVTLPETIHTRAVQK